MKYNKCLIAAEIQSMRCRSDIRGRLLTCVYPQVDFEMMGGAERLATVGAILGGRAHAPLAMLGQRRLNGPRRLPQVLPNIWSTHRDSTRRERQMEGVLSATSNQPLHTSQHNTFFLFFLFFPFFLSPLSVSHCPSFFSPRSNVRTPHKVKRIKQVHGPRYFPP